MKFTFEPLETHHAGLLSSWELTRHDKTQERPQNSIESTDQKFVIHASVGPIGYIHLYHDYDSVIPFSIPRISKKYIMFDMFIADHNYRTVDIGSNIIKKFLTAYASRYVHVLSVLDPHHPQITGMYENAGFHYIPYHLTSCSIYLWKNSENLDLFYALDSALINHAHTSKTKKLLDQFDMYDFLSMPIVIILVCARKLILLKLLHKEGIPLTYTEDHGNALHIACAITGSLACVKFFIENNILTDIHEQNRRDQYTPLTLAICFKHSDIVKYFKEKFSLSGVSFHDLNVILEFVKDHYGNRFFQKIRGVSGHKNGHGR